MTTGPSPPGGGGWGGIEAECRVGDENLGQPYVVDETDCLLEAALGVCCQSKDAPGGFYGELSDLTISRAEM